MLTIHINRNQARILAETLIASALCAIGRKVADIFKKRKQNQALTRKGDVEK
jgi:hypothetical protein